MVKVSDLKSASQIAEEEVTANPAIRREVERTALANAVAIRVIEYRADHNLSQTQLARLLGMQQSAIARLESGDHEPSLATLGRLAKGLGIDFHINITSEGLIELDSPQQEESEQENVLQLLREYAEENIRSRQSQWIIILHASPRGTARIPDVAFCGAERQPGSRGRRSHPRRVGTTSS
jgi:transcriptional regulator with XRE-family HTH domain